jgi:hypothetical protein
MKLLRHFIWLLLAVLPVLSFSQSEDLERFRPEQRKDVQLWTSVGIKQRIGEHWQWRLVQGFRFDNNISQKKNFLTEATIVYRFRKDLRLAGLYRFSNRNEFETDRHRFGAKLYYSKDIKRFSLNYRLYYQHEIETGKLAENQLRNRITVSYDIKKLKINPYIAAEHFFEFHHQGNETAAMRYTAGADIELTKKLGMTVYYRFQNQLNRADPLHSNILGLKLSYTLTRVLL